MALDASMKALFTSTVTVNSYGSTDQYGSETVTATSTHKARIVDRYMTQYSRTGEILRYEGIVWIAPASDGTLPTIVPGQTTVSLPDGQEQRILSYNKFNDPEAGLDHIQLFYGMAGAI